ncbi:MAG TPA: hypothetical protein VI612_01665 [Candidatus Nanoarchaeia archaeon]|nr:hypothetical protein [Candidatus Nanoarchaeia archaeon]
MKFYRLREEDRQYLYSLLYATGIILFWRGVWEVSYELPLLKNVYFALFVGLLILTVTGYMYREFDPFSRRLLKVNKLLHDVVNLSKQGQPHEIYYYDEVGKDHHVLNPHKIRKIEHDFIVFEEKGHEVFIPTHRITRIHKGKQVIWKR